MKTYGVDGCMNSSGAVRLLDSTVGAPIITLRGVSAVVLADAAGVLFGCVVSLKR